MTQATISAPRQYTAFRRNLRQSAQKARLVMDLVRGKRTGEALKTLKFTHNRAARHIEKLIRSAMANAEDCSNRENLGLDAAELVIADARVDQGLCFSRWRARSRGSAASYQRYYCHLEVKLCGADDLDALKLHRQIASQKRRIDRIKDLKGLERTNAAEPAVAAASE